MIKRSVLILLAVMLLCSLRAQEFRCAVSVNYQKLQSTTQSYESTDKRVFDNMKQALEDFINSRRWTNLEFEQHEKIDCSFSLILSERTSPTDFKGQISIQKRWERSAATNGSWRWPRKTAWKCWRSRIRDISTRTWLSPMPWA